MATAKQIIDVAKKYIGTTESPPNSNKCIFNEWFYGKPVQGSAYPWCQTYISFIFNEAGASNLINKTASTESCAKWFKDKGQMHYAPDIQVGDIVFFNFGNPSRFTHHVGIVSKIVDDKTIESIEGNTAVGNDSNGGAVMVRTRNIKDCVGFGRPNYESEEDLKTYIHTPTSISYPSIGVDVSSYQKNVNYLRLRQSGINYAILKIMRKDGDIDNMFETHYKGFIDVGVPVMAVYNYSYATSAEKAKKDAERVIMHLNGKQIPVCLDIEDNCQKSLRHGIVDVINTYQEVIEEAGLDFMAYTGMSFYNTYIRPYKSDIKCDSWWIARYYAGNNSFIPKTIPDEKYKPDIGEDIIGWQYSSHGQVSGYAGRLDMNIWYKDIVSKDKKGIVIANKLNIRTKPDTTGDVVGVYYKGERITIHETDPVSGWYRTPKGWISYNYVQV